MSSPFSSPDAVPVQTVSLDEVRAWLGLPRTGGGAGEGKISGISCRAQEVRPGDLFATIDEYLTYNIWESGRTHVAEAVKRGAAALIVEEPLPEIPLPQLQVPSARQAMATVARRLYGCPDQEIALVGITGTNGKTTTSQLCAHLLRSAFGKTASMGTLGVFLDGEKIEDGEYTTDLIHVLCRRFRRLVELGVGAATMEVSSHALALERVAQLRFRAAVLTNLTRDHLDFHGTAEAYAEAKRKLFQALPTDGVAILNADDPAAGFFAAACAGRVVRYSSRGAAVADIRATQVECTPAGTRFHLVTGEREFPVESRLIGRFQVDNILAAFAVLHGLGHDLELAAEWLPGFLPVSGRMECTALPNGATAIVDFAHNPDGLANLLANCRELTTGRLHLVFGCGGDRDRGKRAIMGKIAAEGADFCWVTSDNPRTEDPQRIIADILQGFQGFGPPRVEADREAAIRQAYLDTRQEDLLVIAGKGHEAYQLVQGKKIPFSDAAVVASIR